LPYDDGNTNTNLTLFRLQSPGLGRWLSPDPLGGDNTNPQSLNRYAYVLNNPTTFVDSLGLLLPVQYTCFNQMGMCPGDATAWAGGMGWTLDLGYWSSEGDLVESYPLVFTWASWLAGYSTGPAGGGGLAILPLPVMSRQALSALLPSCLQATGGSIDSYLELQNSPMVGQGNNFVSYGVGNGVDPRFLVALAGAESSFGNNTNATWGLYNAFGWTGGTSWTNWGQGISTVANGIAYGPNYFQAGRTSTNSIYLGTYCKGPGCATAFNNLNTFLTEQGGNPNNVPCP
jgi:RHS repeat-associated protein